MEYLQAHIGLCKSLLMISNGSNPSISNSNLDRNIFKRDPFKDTYKQLDQLEDHKF